MRNSAPALAAIGVAFVGHVLAQGVQAQTARAQSVQDVLREARLLGDWQIDCAAPVAKSNIRTRYVVLVGSGVALLYDAGKDGPQSVNDITSAKRLGPDRIGYTSVNRDSGLLLEVEVLMTDGRIRVWSSRRPDGQYLVEKGVMTGSNRASPLQSRCK